MFCQNAHLLRQGSMIFNFFLISESPKNLLQCREPIFKIHYIYCYNNVRKVRNVENLSNNSNYLFKYFDLLYLSIKI